MSNIDNVELYRRLYLMSFLFNVFKFSLKKLTMIFSLNRSFKIRINDEYVKFFFKFHTFFVFLFFK